jgi:hypothetical protein
MNTKIEWRKNEDRKKLLNWSLKISINIEWRMNQDKKGLLLSSSL